MGSIGEFKANLTKVSKESGENYYMASVSNDIYFENDNETAQEFELTQEFIDSLKPGDKLVLSADGRDEQCGYGEDD